MQNAHTQEYLVYHFCIIHSLNIHQQENSKMHAMKYYAAMKKKE